MTLTVSAGVEFQRPFRLLDVAHVEIAAGNLSIAAELAEDGIEAADDAGNDQAAAWLGYPLGVAEAVISATSIAPDSRPSSSARAPASRKAEPV